MANDMDMEDVFNKLLDRSEENAVEAEVGRKRIRDLESQLSMANTKLTRAEQALAASRDEVGKLQARVATLQAQVIQPAAPQKSDEEIPI